MAFLRYTDRPGVVGTLGRILGEVGVNIAGMQVARSTAGGDALVALTVDSTIPAGVLTDIAGEIGATSARAVDLTD
jgi:D-3-phosphoglycerate dehydrogenase